MEYLDYAGRLQLGDEVVVTFVTRDASDTPHAPTEAPKAFVYESDGGVVFGGVGVPSVDWPLKTGRFRLAFPLDERFGEGDYDLLVTWSSGGTPYGRLYRFTVLPGGDASGQVNQLYQHTTPSASFLVQGRDSGRIYKGKNPRAG